MLPDPFALIDRSAQLSKEIAVKYARVPGVHILVRQERCTGCGACVRKGFCRLNAISVEERKAVVNDRTCRGCGRCTHLCPRGALALELRPPAVVQNTLKRLDQEVSKII